MSAAFFLSHWGINAEPLGRHDAGIALALAFASAYAVYASLGLAGLAAAATLAAAVTRQPVRLGLLTLTVSLLPLGYLLLLDVLASR